MVRKSKIRSKRKYEGIKGTYLDTKKSAKKKRTEKHETRHPNDKGVVNNPSGICKWCNKHISELRKDPTLLHFDTIEKKYKGRPV